MVEYGNGVGQATGAAGGGGGQTMDAGAAVGQFVDRAMITLGAMPPWQLALLVVIVVAGFLIFRRAF